MASAPYVLLSLSMGVALAAEKRVAIVMAGHARTYNLTAMSWRQKLVRANPSYDFWLYALSYTTGERKAPLRSTVKAPPLSEKITVEILQATYGNVVGSERVIARVVSEKQAQKFLPAKLRSSRKLINTHNKQRSRISMMFTMVSEAFSMVRQTERSWKRRFDIVIKARFDLQLLADFILTTAKVAADPQKTDLPVVVPLEMALGPSHLSPKQIRTRPCNDQGTQRPHWVQDHIAWSTSRAMEFYCNGTARAVLAGTQKRQVRPELILATALKNRRIIVKCDPSIRYTILR